MELSNRVRKLIPSLTRQLFDMAQKFPNVIDLTLGDPDIVPPKIIRNEACRSIQEGNTRYSQNAGLECARKAIAAFNSKQYRHIIDPDEVILTCGGMGALYLMLFSLLNTGDEVLIPAPYWINYKQMTQLCGGVPVIVPTFEEDNFEINVESLAASVTSRTRVIIINSPNNPTGRIISFEALDALARLAVERNIFVISDEVYRSLIYDDKKHESIRTRPGMRERCAVIDSMSKRFSMTGYRLGYAIGPKDLIQAMTRLQENVVACAPLPSQYAAIAAYSQEINTCEMLHEFTLRRQVIMDGIREIPKVSLSGIDGTFYAFVNIEKTGLNSFDFATRLLKCRHVAVVPGRTYGEEYDSYIRIAFTVNCKRLKDAMSRIKTFVLEDL